MGRTQMITIESDRLKKRLTEMKLTQPQLAKQIHVSYTGLNQRINAGKMSSSMFHTVCQVLNLHPDYLKGETDQDNGYKAYQDRNWKAGLDAAKAAFQAWEQNRPRISVSMDYNNGMKSYYLTCDRAPLEAVLTAIIQAGGYNELQANLQPLTADNVKALEAAPKIYD